MSNWYYYSCEARIRQKEIQDELDRARLVRSIRATRRGARTARLMARLGRFLVWLGLRLQGQDRVNGGEKSIPGARASCLH
ncbi:MAG: hypothetical protein V1816_11645 [Pseudomonadota bacterium]